MKKSNSQPLPPASDSPSAGDDEFLRITANVPESIEDNPDAAGAAKGGTAEAAVDAIPPEVIASALGPTFQAAFHAIASARGPHWELIDFEKNALVKGWTPILQYMLAKLGNQEQVLLSLAVMSTAAIVGGKAAQDIKLASSRANTRMPVSEASSVSSASATPEKQPAQNGSYVEDAA